MARRVLMMQVKAEYRVDRGYVGWCVDGLGRQRDDGGG